MSDLREAFEALNWLEREAERAALLFHQCEEGSFQAIYDRCGEIRAALQSQTAPAVPEGWKLVPIEPTDDMLRKSNWSGNGDVSVNEEWARRTVWDRMLAAAPQPDRIAEGGDVDLLAFGSGDYTVEVGGYVDQHAVFIAPARPSGIPGTLAHPTTGADKHRVAPDERVMTFPTEAQAFAVAEAIAGRRINRLDGSHPATPSPDHSGDAGKVAFVDGVGAQRMTAEECKEGIEYIIHGDNIYWPLSDDDELRLIQAACGNGEFTYPVATPSVPENEIKARALEEYADQLDVVFANAQEAGASDCPAWHAGQFAKDARKQAARLRTAGDEGEGV